MAETILMATIRRNDVYPKMFNVYAPACCGVLRLQPDSSFTEKMRCELPTITVNIYIPTDEGYSLYESRAISVSILSSLSSNSNILVDIPVSCVFGVVPNFDNFAFDSHNEDVMTSEDDKWTTVTEEFPIQVVWDDTNVIAQKNTDGPAGELKPCRIVNITDVVGGHTVTFEWTNDDGSLSTSEMTVWDGEGGVSIVSAGVDERGHLIFTQSDGSKIDAGSIAAGAQLTEPLVATVDIGKVTNGTTYPTGTPLETIIRDMLIKYQKPTVSLAITPSTTLYDAVTGSISSIKLTAVVKKNTKPVTQVRFIVANNVVNTITTGVANGGTFTYTYTPSTPITSNITFSASTTDGQETSTSSINVVFIGKSYYGTVNSDISEPTEAQVKALNNTLKNSKSYTYLGITMTFGKVVYAYPKSLGVLSKIMDTVNNLNYTDNFARTEKTIDGIAYYVYTQIDPSAAENIQLSFT